MLWCTRVCYPTIWYTIAIFIEEISVCLHPVCRLLELEKEEHLALKDTWGMANDRFLETQRVQKLELDKIKNLLTIEQLKLIGEDPGEKNETVKLLIPPSPLTGKRFMNRKLNKRGTNKKDNVRTNTSSLSEPKRSLASLVRGPKSSSLPSSPSSILDVSIFYYLPIFFLPEKARLKRGWGVMS